MHKKKPEQVGTVEQTKYSLRKILIELYIEQYGLEGLTSEERDEKIQERNMELEEQGHRHIASEEYFIRERRKWFEKIVDSLIEDGAYDEAMQYKPFVYTKLSGLKDFVQATLTSGDEKSETLRKWITHKQYMRIEEDDVKCLRFWIQTLYEEAGYSADEVKVILDKFDVHFPRLSLGFKKVQNELYDLNYYLAVGHHLQFTDEDCEKIFVELQKLNEYVEGLMRWDVSDNDIIRELNEKYRGGLQK